MAETNIEAGAAPDHSALSHGESKARVLLVDDHTILREELKRIINAENDMEVVGEAAEGQQAIDRAQELKPDLVVMDIAMPHMNGIVATRHIVSHMPEVKVIGLSLNERHDTIDAMMAAGACDYLFKTNAFELLCATIRKHLGGGPRSAVALA